MVKTQKISEGRKCSNSNCRYFVADASFQLSDATFVARAGDLKEEKKFFITRYSSDDHCRELFAMRSCHGRNVDKIG